MTETLQNIKYTIGLDLGDGESSIAFVAVNDHEQPVMFETDAGEKTMITVVAKSLNYETLIGDEALQLKNVQDLSVNFKFRPTENEIRWGNTSQLLLVFAKEYYRRLEKKYGFPREEVQIYIGHPSGWDVADKDKYQQLFRYEKDLPPVEIVPESRAAFIHVRDFSGISDDQLTSVLVVDIGSSTTDFTFVNNLIPKDLRLGENFGARLIDEAILEYVLAQQTNASRIRERLSADPNEYRYLMFLCRKAKEACFNGAHYTPQPAPPSFQPIVATFQEALQQLNIDDIVQRPLPNSSSSWMDSYRHLLIAARDEIKPDLPKVVLITGGGSRMPFTRTVCREVFPESALNPDREASYSIARGLAGFGRWRYRVNQFYNDIETLCQSPEVEQEIHKYMPSYFEAFYNYLYQFEVQRDLAQSMGTFYEGELMKEKFASADEAMDAVFRFLHNWMSTPKHKTAQQKISSDFARKLEPWIGKASNKICGKYQIDRGSLKIDLYLSADDLQSAITYASGFLKVIARLNKYSTYFGAKAWKFYPKIVRSSVLKLTEVTGPLVSSSLSQIFPIQPTDELQAKFVGEVREQIRTQLLGRAKNVERLLR